MSQNDLDDRIDQAAAAFAESLAQVMPQSPAIRAGVQTQGVVSLVWALFDKFPDLRYDLVEALDGWGHTLNNRIDHLKSTQAAAEAETGTT